MGPRIDCALKRSKQEWSEVFDGSRGQPVKSGTFGIREGDCSIDELYIPLEVLSRGVAGVVQRAQRKSDATEVLLNVIQPEAPELLRIATSEFAVLRRLKHPNLLQTFDLMTSASQVVIVTEHFEASTLTHVVRNASDGRLSEATAIRCFTAMLQAVDYLHQAGLVHGHIKPENVHVTHDLRTVKLGDFSSFRRFMEEAALTMTGFWKYSAPESLSEQGRTSATDVWALGVCFHFMLTGRMPRSSQLPSSCWDLASAAGEPEVAAVRRFSLEGARLESTSTQCKVLLKTCLDAEPESRPTAAEALAALAEMELADSFPLRS